MDRLQVIQYLINKKKYKQYLEIGVFNGDVFFKTKVSRKFAVDPLFRFVKETKFKMIFKNVSNLNAKYFTKTSDEFFKDDAPGLFFKKKIDICFKIKRPKFVQAINLLVEDAIRNNKSLKEDSVKLYKGFANE